MRTRVVFASDAPVATITRVEERKRHAITLYERSPYRVAVNPGTDGVDNPRELVPRDTPHRTLRTIAITTPTVQIRATDHSMSVLDQNPARFNLRSRQLLDLVRNSRCSKYGDFSGWHDLPLL